MNKTSFVANAFNIGFFSCAAAASFYVVYESWFYGFFLSPFPLLITTAALLFTGAAIAAVLVACKGPTVLRSNVDSSSHVSGWMRMLALLAPIPLFAFAGLSLTARSLDPCIAGNQFIIEQFVNADKFVFGIKRADDRYGQLIDHCNQHHASAMAISYAQHAAANLEHLPMFTMGPQSYKERHIGRLEQLAVVYEHAGQYSNALDSWLAAHRVAHETWQGARLNTECMIIRSHQTHDCHLLGRSDGKMPPLHAEN